MSDSGRCGWARPQWIVVLVASAIVACGAPERGASGEGPVQPEPALEISDPQARAGELVPERAWPFRYRHPYRFTTDWFSHHIPRWAALLQPYIGKANLKYLEVGVYEGRSFLWMLDRVLTHPGSHATGIDIHVPENLTYNLGLSGAADRVTMLVGASGVELRKLPAESFDIVYIDGSHAAHDVLEDLVLSWRLLRHGGLMLLDDYGHDGANVTGGAPLPDELRPRIAIDAFVSAQRSYVEILHKGYQMALRKRTGVCGRGPWQCSSIGRYSYDWRLKVLYDGETDVELSPSERALVEELIKAKQGDALTLRLDRDTLRSPELEALDARLGLGLRLPDGAGAAP